MDSKEEYLEKAKESFLLGFIFAMVGPFSYLLLIFNVDLVFWMDYTMQKSIGEIIFSNAFNGSFQIYTLIGILFLFIIRMRSAKKNIWKRVNAPLYVLLGLIASNLLSLFFRRANGALVFLILSTVMVVICFIVALVRLSKS
jgi:hypothetical protein